MLAIIPLLMFPLIHTAKIKSWSCQEIPVANPAVNGRNWHCVIALTSALRQDGSFLITVAGMQDQLVAIALHGIVSEDTSIGTAVGTGTGITMIVLSKTPITFDQLRAKRLKKANQQK